MPDFKTDVSEQIRSLANSFAYKEFFLVDVIRERPSDTVREFVENGRTSR